MTRVMVAVLVAATTFVSSAKASVVLEGPGRPNISYLTLQAGLPGSEVPILGTWLQGATAVHFGETAATFRQINGEEIVAIAPVGAGSVTVTVTTPAGTTESDSFADLFTLLVPPPPPPPPPVVVPPVVSTTTTSSSLPKPKPHKKHRHQKKHKKKKHHKKKRRHRHKRK